jgi:hypothetical protein
MMPTTRNVFTQNSEGGFDMVRECKLDLAVVITHPTVLIPQDNLLWIMPGCILLFFANFTSLLEFNP